MIEVVLVRPSRMAGPPALCSCSSTWARAQATGSSRIHHQQRGGKVALRRAAADRSEKTLRMTAKRRMGWGAHLHLAELLCHGGDVALQVCTVVPQLALLRGRGCSTAKLWVQGKGHVGNVLKCCMQRQLDFHTVMLHLAQLQHRGCTLAKALFFGRCSVLRGGMLLSRWHCS